MSTAALRILPVPALEHTVAETVRAAGAVVDEATLRGTREAARAFLAGPGPRLQRELEAFAAREEAAGRSWLSGWWLRDYLAVREPLPLSTNVSFQIGPGFLGPVHAEEGPDVARAARFLRRAAFVHLAEAAGRTPQETDARGNPTTMDQWRCFAGGLRHPQPEVDGIRWAEAGAARREIGVFREGRLYAVPISDADGAPLPARTLEVWLRAVLREATPASLPFAAASALGSAQLAPLLAEALEDPRNAATYGRLRDLLFTVTLTDEVMEDAQHLRRLAFEPSRVWAYRPISYEIGLRNAWLCLHAEHSTVDGATLVTAIRRMQEAEGGEAATPGAPAASASAGGGAAGAGAPRELVWHWSGDAAAAIRQGLERARREAADRATAVVTVPRPRPEDLAALPLRISADALQQLILGLAQRLACGRVRATYEAVDMREYQAGRTECLRPVTGEAVTFIEALTSGYADMDMLSAALEAHRAWVKACKRGEGVDRHLLGLRRIGEDAGQITARGFLEDPGVRAATTDFLSTTSIGGAEQIRRYAFSPSVPEGYGISYTPHPEAFEYCVTWRRSTADAPQEFLAALPRAASLLTDLLHQLAR